MVELLEPRPGQRVLELAAGPGETGFRALPLHPARRRAPLDGRRPGDGRGRPPPRRGARARPTCGSRSRTPPSLSLDDDTVDGVLCRFGLMLVPDMDRAAAEIARVLRPGGRAVLAVWASSRLNPWMTATGQGGARARARRPARSRCTRAVPARRPGPAAVGRGSCGPPDRSGRGRARGLGRRVARRVVGDVARHLAHARDAARAADAGRGRGPASAGRRPTCGSTWRTTASLAVPGVARVVAATAA